MSPFRSQRIRRAVVALLALTFVVGANVTTAAPASAASSSTITSQYWWPHNGCTRVPDSPAWPASFTYACNHHDGCYALRWSSSRATCDWWFYNDMRAACNAKWYVGSAFLQSCYFWATTYYGGVRALGQQYWDSSGALTRISTPMTTG